MNLAGKIFLVGMPGSGKTTLGGQLASSLGTQFIDLDDVITEHEGRSINEMFEAEGEEYFRKAERDCLIHTIKTHNHFVLATGGGTPCFFDNVEIINDAGMSFFLDVPVSELVKRLRSNELAKRPKLSSVEDLEKELTKILSLRRLSYEKADVILTPGDIHVAHVMQLINAKIQ